MFAAGLRPIAVLALAAASLALFAFQSLSDFAFEFERSNSLEPQDRALLIKVILGAAVVTGGAAFVYARVSGHTARARLRRWSNVLAPLTLMGLVPPIVNPRVWPDAFFAATAIGAFVVLFEILLRVSLKALDEGKALDVPHSTATQGRRYAFVVLAFTLVYAIYMSRYTLFAHQRFQTYNFDLGQYDNLFWNALHGRPMVCTPLGAMKNWSSLSGHAELGIYFFMPFYAIYPHAETLLIMQSCVIALGALPLYFFAVRRVPAKYAALLSICYLLFPPMHGANFYDFHMQPIAATCVLTTIWLVDARRWIPATLAFIVAISCREDISVGLTMFGLYLVLAGRTPRAGLLIAFAGSAYFVVMRFFIMARFGPGWFSDIYKDLYPLPKGPNSYGGVMQTLMTNPVFVFRTLLTGEKLRFFLQVMTPLAFLPLRRAYLLPALAPGAMFTLLTTQYGPTTDISFQYSAHFTPYIFTAAAVALGSYLTKEGTVKARAAAAGLVVGTLLCTRHWGAFPPNANLRGGFSTISFATPSALDRQKARDLAELAAMIPEGASFAVSESELPHVSGRSNLMTLRHGVAGAEYLLFGAGGDGQGIATEALARGEYTEVAKRTAVTLLRRK